jgi:hypothetical protein
VALVAEVSIMLNVATNLNQKLDSCITAPPNDVLGMSCGASTFGRQLHAWNMVSKP